MSSLSCRSDCDLNRARGAEEPLSTREPRLGVKNWLSGGAAVFDDRGKILSANEALAAWLGTPVSELEGEAFPRWLGRRHPQWEEAFHGWLETGPVFEWLELASADEPAESLRLELCRHGSTCFLRVESALPPLAELEQFFPETCWGALVGHDLFQRMLRSEVQVENLLRCWPGVLFSQRPDFSFVFISPKVEEWTGVSAAEWRRHSSYFWKAVHEADAPALEGRLRAEAQSAQGTASTYRIRHLRTGRITHLWEHRRAVRTRAGLTLGFEGLWMDISRQTLAERRLLDIAWKEDLGTLSMGMAHDFCNLMTGIVGLSQTLEAGLEPQSPTRNALGLIRNSALQGSQMAHRLRQLHDGRPGEKTYLDLNESVTGLAELLQKVLPRSVRVQTALGPGQLPLYADAVELRHVLVNLALNASDAMTAGGTLTFHTARHETMAPGLRLQGAAPRPPIIRLSVQDTGVGIPEHLVASIFEPFFTTKPLGKGSGLGLYNARLFAEKHGAAISVETKRGEGTTFHFWFPQADFNEVEQPETSEAPARHTLLLVAMVDDVLDNLVALLRQNGYYAVPATTEAQALESLLAPYFQFTGILVVCGPNPAEALPLCLRLRAAHPAAKTMLGVFSSHQDSAPTNLMQAVDALMPLDLPAPDFLARLKGLLNETPNHARTHAAATLVPDTRLA